MDLSVNSRNSLRVDTHTCGECGIKFNNIEDFVYHKIHEEKFKLRLQPSTKIKDFFIPTFHNKGNQKKITEDQNTEAKTITSDSENSWQCDACRKIFTEDFILQVHKRQFSNKSHASSPSPPSSGKNCNFCGINFESIKSRKRHRGNQFSCNYKNCTYTFKTKGSLKRHERRHTGERPYSCELCGRNFTESGALHRHKRSRILCTSKSDSDLPRYGKRMEDNKLGNIIDGTDNAVLDDLDAVDNELNDSPGMKISDENDEKLQICDICDASFETVKDLRNHLFRHTGSKQYIKCGVCKFISYEKDEVIDHIEKFHQEFNSETPHEVEVNLIIHQDANEALQLADNDVYVLKCGICEQTFETNDDLTIHLLNHSTKTNKERYSCTVCSKEFLTKSKLRKHALSHSEQRNFRCSECGKLFKRITQARKHIKTTHSEERPFECLVCKKQFKTTSTMKTHMKIHEEELPFTCHWCGKSFRQKASLQRHMRIHTGERPFVCRYCGQGFAEHGTLNRHLKAKSPCYFRSINQLPSDEINHQQLLIQTLDQTNHEENLVDINLPCELETND